MDSFVTSYFIYLLSASTAQQLDTGFKVASLHPKKKSKTEEGKQSKKKN
jgi:hypothetical protein